MLSPFTAPQGVQTSMPPKRARTSLLAGLIFLYLPATSIAQENTLWWKPHESNPGFIEALAEFKLTPAIMNNNPQETLRISTDKQEPLYWLRRTLQQYSGSTQSHYQVPVTEIHANGKKRTGMSGRYGFFTTPIFLNASQRVEITRHSPNSQVICSAWTGTNFNVENNVFDKVILGASPTPYTAVRSGTLIVSCEDATRDMQNTEQQVSISVKGAEANHVPLFIFGITSSQEWKTRISQEPNMLNQVLLYTGRSRLYVPAIKAQASADIDIMRLMREHLLMTLEDDRVNGFTSTPSTPLNLPTEGLVNASYAGCCSASGGQGLVRIGFNSKIAPSTFWGDWHEYGHLYQTEWSWDGLIEVSVNLYSIASCRRIRGAYYLKDCQTNQAYINRTWDREAVGNYLKTGPGYEFDNMGGGTEFIRSVMLNQLLSAYDTLYPRLGQAFREQYHYADNAGDFNTTAKKKDWFVINASRFSGHDLSGFFDKWGVIYSDDARATIAEMKLPLPIQPTAAYTHEPWVITATTASTANGELTDHKAKNIGFIAYEEKEGPTQLVWSESQYSRLTVPVWDELNRMSLVHFRAVRSQGTCAAFSLNSTSSCESGAGTHFWSIQYVPEDNRGLTGINRGRIQLAARDWKVVDWGSQVDIPFTITGTNQ